MYLSIHFFLSYRRLFFNRNCGEKDDTFNWPGFPPVEPTNATTTRNDDCFDSCRQLAKILSFEWNEFVTPLVRPI